MDRPKRIRIVAVSAVGIFSLFVAFIGAPLVAAAFWTPPDFSGDLETVKESFAQASQTPRAANTVSMIALAVAGACFVYLLVVAAAWFIGPKITSPDADA